MNTTQDDGGPAFPNPLAASEHAFGTVDEYANGRLNGMSLRDWFAGMALQGLLACTLDSPGEDYPDKRDKLCRVAFEYADAMLDARKEKP